MLNYTKKITDRMKHVIFLGVRSSEKCSILANFERLHTEQFLLFSCNMSPEHK